PSTLSRRYFMSGSLFANSFRASAKPSRDRHRAQKKRARFLPMLELLEGRDTPSQTLALDDWPDTDGNNPVTVANLANDSPSMGMSGNPPVTLRANTVSIQTHPLHGTLNLNHQTGDVTYTAFGNFTGTDTFTYRVRDSLNSLSNLGTVNIQVNRPTA